MSKLSDFLGYAPKKMFIWRATLPNVAPLFQQAAYRYDPAYAIATPVRLWSGSFYQALSAASGTDIFSSPNGKAWTLRTLPYSQLWRGITHNGAGTFICTGGTNTTQYAFSTNGTTWTGSTAITTPADWGQCAFGAGLFVVVTNGTSSATQYSSNATSWTAGAAPGTVSRIKFLNDRFFAGNGHLGSFYSTNGTTWSSVTGAGTAINSMTYGNAIWAGVSSTATNWVYVSTNGTSFAPNLLPVTATWAEIGFDATNNLFVLVAADTSGIVLTSADCITWNQRKNFDTTSGAGVTIFSPDGLVVQQGGLLRLQDFAAVEVSYLI